MNKWRINRLRINGFKVFSSFEEHYESDLIIYDGPNGFGKTSLFDAKQLLFLGKLPRIAARLKPVTPQKHSFKSNLYRHNGYTGDICIVAELTNGSESISIMRKAEASEMKSKKNKPSEFSIFKLYQLVSFNDWASAVVIKDENAFWQQHLGRNFQNNFDVLNYLQQDSKALVIPDGCCEDTTRTKQIEHLINLDELEARRENISNLKVARKSAYDQELKNKDLLDKEITLLKQQLSAPGEAAEYCRLTTMEPTPIWDSEAPLTIERVADYPSQLAQVNLLRTLLEHSSEIELRERNRKKRAFLQTEEFALAICIVPHFHKLQKLKNLREQRKPLNQAITIAKKSATELKVIDLPPLKQSLADQFDDFCELVKTKEQLQTYQGKIEVTKNKTLELRNRLKAAINQDEAHCPLCGFDYNEQKLLIDAIDIRTKKIERELDINGQKVASYTQKISLTLQTLLPKLEQQLVKIDTEFNPVLLRELELNEHLSSRLIKIAERIQNLNITLPTEYLETQQEKTEQVEIVRQQIQSSFEAESDLLTEQALAFYHSTFRNSEELKVITQDLIEKKLAYLHSEHNKLISKTHAIKLVAFNQSKARLEAISKVENKLKETEKQLNLARNTYINKTLGEIELLFHIYSGRLLQNMQTGLGIFLERTEGTQKDTPLQFKTAKGNEHDAVLSMSSGQISALALALFLALNKKYAETAFVFIDDPTQCMDEINIASLSDLLRVEFRDRQVIMSTHEQDIANYLIYRYGKAGLSHKKINLLKKHRDEYFNNS